MQAALDSRRKQRRISKRQHTGDQLQDGKLSAGARDPAAQEREPQESNARHPAPSDTFGLQLTPREESDESRDGEARKQEVRSAWVVERCCQGGTREPLLVSSGTVSDAPPMIW